MNLYKNLVVILIVSSTSTVFGQSRCGIVYDEKTLLSVPYVSISSPTSSNFLFTDERGKYCLENISLKDTFYISALGYKRLVIDGKILSQNDSLFIVGEPIQLNEIKIAEKINNNRLQRFGFFDAKFLQKKNSFVPNSSMKIAVYLKNGTSTNNVIEKIYYKIIPYPSEIASYFRVRVRMYKNGLRDLPGDDLLTENVVLDVSPEQTVITQDILKKNIDTVRGALVGNRNDRIYR